LVMDYLNTHQAGEILGVTSQRILALIRAGRLPAKKVGRDWLVARSDLEGFEKRPQGNFKLTLEQVGQIKTMSRDGTTPLELARKFRVSVRTIYRHLEK
jgi:excisionase family DNA binding protein